MRFVFDPQTLDSPQKAIITQNPLIRIQSGIHEKPPESCVVPGDWFVLGKQAHMLPDRHHSASANGKHKLFRMLSPLESPVFRGP
jgi:hypothetical protein